MTQRDQTRRRLHEQLDDSIGDTLVSGDGLF